MKFAEPLIQATLIKRYKRFLADVTLENGETITVHCPNTGSMKNCWEPGWRVYLLDSQNPKRKYRYTWVLSQNAQGEMIGINTHFANNLIEEALNKGVIAELPDFDRLQREVKYGEENSRIDFLLNRSDQKIYIEVKSVTLLEESATGYFPDAVSTRGQKHLRELIQVTQTPNTHAVLLFCVQHSGIKEVRPASHIDPKYSELLAQARSAGVTVIAYEAELTPYEIKITNAIPVVLDSE